MGAVRQGYCQPNCLRSENLVRDTALHAQSSLFLLSYVTGSQELIPIIYCNCFTVYILQPCPTLLCLVCHVLENICSWTLSLKLSMSVQNWENNWNIDTQIQERVVTVITYKLLCLNMQWHCLLLVFFPRACEGSWVEEGEQHQPRLLGHLPPSVRGAGFWYLMQVTSSPLEMSLVTHRAAQHNLLFCSDLTQSLWFNCSWHVKCNQPERVWMWCRD